MTGRGKSGIAMAMIAVAIVAVGVSLLRDPSSISATFLWTALLTAFLLGALVAILDPRRSFWIGFAVLGLGYTHFLLYRNTVVSPLLTELLIKWYLDNYGERYTSSTHHVYGSFVSTFHALAALIHGLAGGLLAVWLRPRLLKERAGGR